MPRKKMMTRKRSKAMRESWKRRKDKATKAKSSDKTMAVENVLRAVDLVDQLVEVCDGDRDVARALIRN